MRRGVAALALYGLLTLLAACSAGAREAGQEAIPAEAWETLRLIESGGPFPYKRDGIVFGNFEGHLPKQPRGYYREYTVKTPGARNRGARRIVCGPLPECYYTPDHYKTFQPISP